MAGSVAREYGFVYDQQGGRWSHPAQGTDPNVKAFVDWANQNLVIGFTVSNNGQLEGGWTQGEIGNPDTARGAVFPEGSLSTLRIDVSQYRGGGAASTGAGSSTGDGAETSGSGAATATASGGAIADPSAFLVGQMAEVGKRWEAAFPGQKWPPMTTDERGRPVVDIKAVTEAVRLFSMPQKIGDYGNYYLFRNPDGSTFQVPKAQEPQEIEIGGVKYHVLPDGRIVNAPILSLDQQIYQSLSKSELTAGGSFNRNDPNFQRAMAIRNFKNAPTQKELFDIAMDLATSPADQLTVMMMRAGDLPIQQGQYGQRIGPLSPILQDAVQNLFNIELPSGPAPAQAPGAAQPSPETQGSAGTQGSTNKLSEFDQATAECSTDFPDEGADYEACLRSKGWNRNGTPYLSPFDKAQSDCSSTFPQEGDDYEACLRSKGWNPDGSKYVRSLSAFQAAAAECSALDNTEGMDYEACLQGKGFNRDGTRYREPGPGPVDDQKGETPFDRAAAECSALDNTEGTDYEACLRSKGFNPDGSTIEEVIEEEIEEEPTPPTAQELRAMCKGAFPGDDQRAAFEDCVKARLEAHGYVYTPPPPPVESQEEMCAKLHQSTSTPAYYRCIGQPYPEEPPEDISPPTPEEECSRLHGHGTRAYFDCVSGGDTTPKPKPKPEPPPPVESQEEMCAKLHQSTSTPAYYRCIGQPYPGGGPAPVQPPHDALGSPFYVPPPPKPPKPRPITPEELHQIEEIYNF